jgi:hypothetical protein
MKLTEREKILLPAALIIIAAILFINFIYLPLSKEISTLKTQVEENELLISESTAKQNAIKSLEDKLVTARKTSQTEHQDVLQSWDQPELIVFVEDTINSLCEKTSIDFFDVMTAQAVQAGEVNIVFTTDYESLQRIIKKFEDAKYYNTITLFDIHEPETVAPDGEKLLEVSLNIRFYSKNLNSSYPVEYSFMDDAYGKTNIFK